MCGFCGVNKHLAHYVEGRDKNCPVCDAPCEMTAHITVCDNPERSHLYHHLVNTLVTLMCSHDTAPLLAHLIEHYLRA